MFSYFDGGIGDTKCSDFLDLSSLIRKIKFNPHAEKINRIRSLRQCGDDTFKTLKRQLPYITPNCMVKVRSLGGADFGQNFISGSGFIYFDFDVGFSDAHSYKNYFIKQYGHLASMVCLSSSGGGISALFKVKNTITKENFNGIWLTMKNTYFKEEKVDEQCKDLGRAMFISHDKSVFYKYENELDIDLNDIPADSIQKQGKQCNSYEFYDNTLNSPFSIIPIEEVLKKLNIKTPVEVQNPIVDYAPVEYLKFYIPEIIKDGTKHSTYFSMINTLVDLNPDIDRDYIFSFMSYINNRFAKPKMEKREFVRLFNSVYNRIKNTGETQVKTKIKSVHFNPNSNLTKKEKISVANHVNGKKRMNRSIQKVVDAKTELEKTGRKITQKAVCKLSGLSPKTVRKHFDSKIIDIDEEIQIVNDSFSTIPIFSGSTSLDNVA